MNACALVLHEALETAVGDRERCFALNEAIHLRLLAIDGSRWRQQMVGDLREDMKLNRHHLLFKGDRLQDSRSERRAIMAALLQRDADRTRTTMQAHVHNGLASATS